MNNSNSGIKEGILKGLKRILFTDSNPVEVEAVIPPAAADHTRVQLPVTASPTVALPGGTGENQREMKLRIYQLLESLNQPGCDFFEVWNAAIEMGGANSTNIRAAYTSLKFADKTLSRDKLITTGEYYVNSLQKVLDTETIKRQQEKDKLLDHKEKEKNTLATEITQLEQQLAAIQQALADKTSQREGINQKYEPQVAAINEKIAGGKQSVNGVLVEMQQVMSIIQKEIN